MFRKLLVANRGEIAARVMRTAKRLGIRTVAVFSEADAGAMHVTMADEAVAIGPAPARDSYLRIDRLIEAARAAGAEAIHPGYGFLSENPAFVEACDAAGIVFVGPPASAMRAMGSKAEAKRLMQAAGVPLVPGYHGEDQSDALLAHEAARIGFPVMIKASAGGGGRGMRAVDHTEDFAAALAAARREAEAAFADGRVLVEKYLQRPRHIEAQILADAHGNVVHLGTRDCSIQRRHQKIIEEAPAPGLSDATREMIHAAAIAAAEACGYVNAGTVEFIAEGSGADPAFYFMEMNTRLQVEHPVTEEVYSIDLVEAQLRIAAGERLPAGQDRLVAHGHAIEVRLCAEEPRQDFRPSTGRIAALHLPEHRARIETGVRAGDSVTPHYDSMIAKLVVHGADRDTARQQLGEALAATALLGPATNLELLRRIVAHPAFADSDLDTSFIARHLPDLLPPPPATPFLAALAAGTSNEIWRDGEDLESRFERVNRASTEADGDSPWRWLRGFRLHGRARERTLFSTDRRTIEVVTIPNPGGLTRLVMPDGSLADFLGAGGGLSPISLLLRIGDRSEPVNLRAQVLRDGDDFQVTMEGDPFPYHLRRIDPYSPAGADSSAAERIAAPIPALVARIDVAEGDRVARGQVLAVLEAMKTEIRITAPADGTVARVLVQPGAQLQEGTELITLTHDEPTP
ncbi:MAG: biotin/lipoyl-binding protein [Acetobacteraceae bacterium]|nr:biotin/lipoyl-binding protein [Acetobacteraceae bacterium]